MTSTAIAVLAGVGAGWVLSVWLDWFYKKAYGFPMFSVWIAKLYNSTNFKWLTYNLWGDDTWYYNIILEEMRKRGRN